jgi:hypothetical protein
MKGVTGDLRRRLRIPGDHGALLYLWAFAEL